jgi:hypothetical protein
MVLVMEGVARSLSFAVMAPSEIQEIRGDIDPHDYYDTGQFREAWHRIGLAVSDPSFLTRPSPAKQPIRSSDECKSWFATIMSNRHFEF